MQGRIETADAFFVQVGGKDWLNKGGVGKNASLTTKLYRSKALLNGSGIRLQKIAEISWHNRHAGIELHPVFQLFEQVQHALAAILIKKMSHSGLGCDEEPGTGIRILIKMTDELPQDAVRYSGEQRGLLKSLRLGREVIIVLPVFAARSVFFVQKPADIQRVVTDYRQFTFVDSV